jgi:hypothetical protein
VSIRTAQNSQRSEGSNVALCDLEQGIRGMKPLRGPEACSLVTAAMIIFINDILVNFVTIHAMQI